MCHDAELNLIFNESSTDKSIQLSNLNYLTFKFKKSANVIKCTAAQAACSNISSNSDSSDGSQEIKSKDSRKEIEDTWLKVTHAHYHENLLGAYNVISGTLSENFTDTGKKSLWSFLIEMSGDNCRLHIIEYKDKKSSMCDSSSSSDLAGKLRGPASAVGKVKR